MRTTDHATIDALVRALVALHDAPSEVPPFSETYPGLDPEDGYLAAGRLHAHRIEAGWKPLGRKIGFTNRTIWPRYGVYEPMWGHVYDRTVIESHDGRATVPLQGLVQPRIEPEVLFKLRTAPPRTDDPERLLEAIEWVAHSIEIVQCHHPGWKLKIADCTADNGLHGRLVVGEPIPVQELPRLARELPELEVVLAREGVPVDRGVGANVLGSPLNALAFLVEVLARRPQAPALVPGEIVSTGVLTDAHPVAPGETWSTAFSGLPLAGLEVSFT
jgi:2-oxo-3-hexenedioate decarboxylase